MKPDLVCDMCLTPVLNVTPVFNPFTNDPFIYLCDKCYKVYLLKTNGR